MPACKQLAGEGHNHNKELSVTQGNVWTVEQDGTTVAAPTRPTSDVGKRLKSHDYREGRQSVLPNHSTVQV